jgi:RIO kinase 1
MLERDVANLRNFFGRFAPELLASDYGGEIWSLFEAGALSPEVSLTGVFDRPQTAVDLESVQREIEDIRLEEAARVRRLQEADL